MGGDGRNCVWGGPGAGRDDGEDVSQSCGMFVILFGFCFDDGLLGGFVVSAGECVESDANRCAFGGCAGGDDKQEQAGGGLWD